jgi:hypothetical protein
MCRKPAKPSDVRRLVVANVYALDSKELDALRSQLDDATRASAAVRD